MHYLKQISFGGLAVLLSACGGAELQDNAKPAVLTESSAQARQVLSTTISTALNGTKVTIGKSAFVNKSELTIQRMTTDPQGMKGLNGTMLGRPVIHQFSMVKQGSSCYVVLQRTGQRYLLNGLSCKAR